MSDMEREEACVCTSTTDTVSDATLWSLPSPASVLTSARSKEHRTRPSTINGFAASGHSDWLMAQIDECLAVLAPMQAKRCSGKASPPALDLSIINVEESIEQPLPSSPEVLGLSMVEGSESPSEPLEVECGSPGSSMGGEKDDNSPLLFCPLVQQSSSSRYDAAPFPYSPGVESVHMLVADSPARPESLQAEFMSFFLEYESVESEDTPDKLTRSPCSADADTRLGGSADSRKGKCLGAFFGSSSTPPTSCSSSLQSTDADSYRSTSAVEEAYVLDYCSRTDSFGCILPDTSEQVPQVRDTSVPKRDTSAASGSPTSTRAVEEARKLKKLKKLLGEEVGPVMIERSPSQHPVPVSHRDVASHLHKPLPKVPPTVTRHARSQTTTDGIEAPLLSYISFSPSKMPRKASICTPKGKGRAGWSATQPQTAPSIHSNCMVCDQKVHTRCLH